MKIYLASSHSNPHYYRIMATLRGKGYEVYDFKRPLPDGRVFSWEEIDRNFDGEMGEYQFRRAVRTELADDKFKTNLKAMQAADVVVLLTPCGRSAHLELGWAAGNGTKTIIMLGENPIRPELMYKMADHIVSTEAELLWALSEAQSGRIARIASKFEIIDGAVKSLKPLEQETAE